MSAHCVKEIIEIEERKGRREERWKEKEGREMERKAQRRDLQLPLCFTSHIHSMSPFML
jgi:hypothetical protein